MGICCVDGCESSENDDVVYFPVPVAAALRRKWRSVVGVSCRLHQDSRICSRHFAETDYERVRGKLRLKARVVPSLFNNRDNKRENSSPISTRTRTPERRASEKEKEDESATERDNDSPLHNQELDSNQDQEMQDLSGSEFGSMRAEAGDIAEYTIECVPEVVLNHDTDSHSDTDLPKEDLEDIIANYHIQQRNKDTADRDRTSADTADRASETDTNATGRKETEDIVSGRSDAICDNKKRDKACEERDSTKTSDPPDGAREREDVRDKDIELIEIEADPEDKPPEFIEISVDGKRGRDQDDCLLVLEKVQVDIDPAALMLHQDDIDGDDERREPISLLTSSDDSDVIIEEPHIDTVEVSSETDEDDKPLVALVKSKKKPTKLTRLLWGNLVEYYCYQCKFTTLSKTESERHKLEHSKILLVCEICNYTCVNSSRMTRHKKKHREEKRYKCQYCDYRARHNMSLVYHMKSHEGVTAEDIQVQSNVVSASGKYRCSDCTFSANGRKSMMRHVQNCTAARRPAKPTTHKCVQCAYKTKRRSDLKRHVERRHADPDDDIED